MYLVPGGALSPRRVYLVPKGGLVLGGCLLLGGVCSQGVSAPGGWVFAPGGSAPGGCAPGGSAPGGCLLQGGVCSWVGGVVCSGGGGVVGIPACTEADTHSPCEQNQTHL